MQHLAMLEMAKRACRASICPDCYQRGPIDPSIGHGARTCEAKCTLFLHMPKLAKAVLEGKTSAESAEEVLRTLVCPDCHASPSAGDYCCERLVRSCPLSRYCGDAIQILERLRDLPHDHHPSPPTSPMNQ